MPTPRSLALLLAAIAPLPAAACPFCASESRTLTEEMDDSSAVVLTRLAEPSEASAKLADADVPPGFIDPETGAARFTVERVLIGEDLVSTDRPIEAIYFGEPNTEQLYLLRGVGTPPDWAIPLPLSDVAAEYVPRLLTLPEEGADRLAFFQDYLEHEDPLLAQDAYDEFARAPYQAVIDLGPRMDRGQLRAWIEDGRVSPSRRRLFLTMLGVCGEPEDLQRLETMLLSDARVLAPGAEGAAAAAIVAGGSPAAAAVGESIRFAERQRKLGLDALVACYLTLAGKHADATEALDLVDRRYLEDPDADYSHVYAVLQALRFLAEEQQDLVPLDRVLVSARLLLDNPDFADQVIPDLARWEDWSVLPRLADMYRATFDADAEDAPVKYVREPIITYLDVAARRPGEVGEEAEAALADLEPLDPDAVERARSLAAFGFLAQARAKQPDPPWVTAEEEANAPDDATEPAEQAEPPAAEATLTEAPAASEMPPNPQPPAEETGEPIAEPGVAEVAAETPPPTPPSRTLLVGAPLAAAAAMIGLFWLILRGGVS